MNPERELIVELCVSTARQLAAVFPLDANGWYETHLGGDFDSAVSGLWQLGVCQKRSLSSKKSDGRYVHEVSDPMSSARCYVMPDDEGRMRSKLSDVSVAAYDKIDLLLEGFLGVHGNFQSDEKPFYCGREYFTPEPGFKLVLDALGANGYLNRQGLKLSWTNKIEPAMRAAFLWE